MMLVGDILGLGHSISSFGVTLALLITFLGIGLVANLVLGYAVLQFLGEREENQERMDAFERGSSAS